MKLKAIMELKNWQISPLWYLLNQLYMYYILVRLYFKSFVTLNVTGVLSCTEY